jgi:ferric-dicitrate binding protein FerR (iron transport regulator)
MDTYNESIIEQLVFDPSFRNWVIYKDQQASEVWKEWLRAHPGQEQSLNHAKAIVYALQLDRKLLSDEEINEEIRKILLRTKNENQEISQELFEPAGRKGKLVYFLNSTWLKIAVVFIIVLSAAFLLTVKRKDNSTVYASYIAKVQKSSYGFDNNTDTVRTILLSDSTKVFLNPKSRLDYSKLSENKREVYLTGEAFFEVSKDPKKPFLVYTQNFVTKVLGTSFKIRAFPGDKKGMIMVRTGKVSVVKSDKFSVADAKSKNLTGIVLTPNQKVIYDYDSKELKKVLVDTPLLVNNVVKEQFHFNATPISKVFAGLQQAYGITIIYDEDIMYSCSLSATLGTESFYDKLDMICKTINATYVIMDGNIVITSKGCK